MKPPHALSDRELTDYAEEHIQYEIDMLTWTASILAFLSAKPNNAGLPVTVANGLLNSFALHARNLTNFLYSRTRANDHPTDIILEDYVDPQLISGHLPPITPLLEEALTKASKQAAHLSMDRMTEYEQKGKVWSFIPISKDILNALAAIAPHIPASRISHSLRLKMARSAFIMPIVDVSYGTFPGGLDKAMTMSLRIAPDGRSYMGISA